MLGLLSSLDELIEERVNSHDAAALAEHLRVAGIVEIFLLGHSQIISELQNSVRVLCHGHWVRNDTTDTARVVLVVHNLCFVFRLQASHGVLVRRLLRLLKLNIASDVVGLASQELLLEVVSSEFVREQSLHFLLAQDHLRQVVVDYSALHVQLLVVGGACARNLGRVEDHLVEAGHALLALLSAEYIALGRDGGRLVADHRVELASRIVEALEELVAALNVPVDRDPLVDVLRRHPLHELGILVLAEFLMALQGKMVARALLQLAEHGAVGCARLLLAEEVTSAIQVQLLNVGGRLERALRGHIGDAAGSHLESLGTLHIEDGFDDAEALIKIEKIVSYICVVD